MRDSSVQKRSRIRVAPQNYSMLRKEILARDNWRCQVCGSLRNLDVHHLSRRSTLGDDTEANLITLCRACHQVQHGSIKSELGQSRGTAPTESMPTL